MTVQFGATPRFRAPREGKGRSARGRGAIHGRKKNCMGRGGDRYKRTLRLLVRIGPVGRFGENIECIVNVVVSILNNSNSHTQFNIVQCDHCSFNSKKNYLMITHMSTEHEDCASCDFCGKYFSTRKLLRDHNRHYHDESEYEETHET